MKKVSFIVLGVFLFSAASVFAADKVYGKAYLKNFKGEVEVSYDWGKTWVTAAPNMSLIRNTIVKTGYEATATISSMDAEIILKDVSLLHLDVLPTEVGGITTLYLEGSTENIDGAGALRLNMTPRPRVHTVFKVATPASTTTIRKPSTSCDVGVYGVAVIKGEVEFMASGYRGSVLVDAGHTGYVDPHGNTAYK